MTRPFCLFMFVFSLAIAISWSMHAEKYGPCTHEQIDTLIKKSHEQPEIIDGIMKAYEDDHFSYGEADGLLEKYSGRYHLRGRVGRFFG